MLIDPDHPFFRAAWRRWLTILVPLGWAGFEFWRGDAFWGLLFGAAGVYALWALVLKPRPPAG